MALSERQSNIRPTSRRVLAEITTSPGAATACSRAARFGVSPIAARSRLSPAPTCSPTTTSPVAMPTRALSWPATCPVMLSTVTIRGQPCLDRPLRVILMRLGIAEIDEYAVSQVLGDEPVKSPHGVGDAFAVDGD